MRPHHQRVVDRLVARFAPDPDFLALIVGGSIARGWERDDSDVDIVLVAADEAYARRARAGDFHYFNRELCDYPGGYVDGKVVDRAFLEDAAARGSEPTRAAFIGVTLAWSRLPGMAGLLARIPVYPEAQRAEKIRSFYAQVQALRWYAGEAEKRCDPYLLARVAADLALFGGRLILAHNRILYPYHKWLLAELRAAPEKPAGLVGLLEALLARPGRATAEAFADAVLGFTHWDADPGRWPARFMEDTEWAWRRGSAPLADA